jgi:chaperonin GroES
MKVKPLRDKVIVKRLEEEEKSPGGIILPDTAKEKPMLGKIISVGKGKVLDNGEIRPPEVKVGDEIIIDQMRKFQISKLKYQ